MSDKLEILKMVESSKITVEEGLQMIEALELTEKIEEEIKESINSQQIDDTIVREADDIEKELNEMSEKAFKTFDVSLTTCKLNVERSNVEEVTIELMDDKTRTFITKPEWLHLNESNNTISIKESRVTNLTDIFDFFKSGNTMLNSVFINVKIPMETIIDKGRFSNVSGSLSLIGLKGGDIEAKSVSGKVYGTDLKAKVIQLKSTSGSVIADSVKAGKCYLKTISGKIKCIGDLYYLECKSVSGAIDIACNAQLNKVHASSISGRISINVTEPESYNLYLESISGNIETNGFAVINKSNSGKRSVSIDNRSDIKNISVSTISGKISIDKL